MTNKINRTKAILLGLGVIMLLLALLVIQYEDSGRILRAAGGMFGLSDFSQPDASLGQVIATSTLQYLSIGAGTTTVTFNTAGTDQVDVNVFVLASSTDSNLRWRVEYSHSTTTIVANQVWFPEPIALTELATTTRLTRNAKEYSWTFASTTLNRLATSSVMNNTFDQNTTSSFTFRIKDIAARWTRLIFYNPTGASTANDTRMDTLSEVTAMSSINDSTSTPLGIQVFVILKQPL